MESDWTVECGADDPWVVVPWFRKDETVRYIDLRITPERLKGIPEAAQNPCIAAALLRWNSPQSSVYTAKCDVWSYAADLFDANDLPGFAFAHASYIDLLALDLAVFSSFASAERSLRNLTRDAQSVDLSGTRCEWILRRARILSAKADGVFDDGFATTLYVWGYGVSRLSAKDRWAVALSSLVEPVLAAAPET